MKVLMWMVLFVLSLPLLAALLPFLIAMVAAGFLFGIETMFYLGSIR